MWGVDFRGLSDPPLGGAVGPLEMVSAGVSGWWHWVLAVSNFGRTRVDTGLHSPLPEASLHFPPPTLGPAPPGTWKSRGAARKEGVLWVG